MNDDQRQALKEAINDAIELFNKKSDIDPIKDVKIKRIEFDDSPGQRCTYAWVKIGGQWYYLCV